MGARSAIVVASLSAVGVLGGAFEGHEAAGAWANYNRIATCIDPAYAGQQACQGVVTSPRIQDEAYTSAEIEAAAATVLGVLAIGLGARSIWLLHRPEVGTVSRAKPSPASTNSDSQPPSLKKGDVANTTG